MTPEIIIPKIIRPALAAGLLFVPAVFAIPAVSAGNQQDSLQQNSAAGQNSMPGMDMGDMQGMEKNSDAARAATGAMSDMSDPTMQGTNMMAHMRMTDLRPANAEDQTRADQILAQLTPAIAKYKDYHVALADGFRIFGPNVPQPIYHFTNYRYGAMAAFKFDPMRPTSLLYKKTATGYELVGVMYTAPKRFSEEQLNARVPLSVARWHEHVNLCLPPRGTILQQINWKEFGPNGSIATESACEAADGRWYPQIFGWMVHVYPFQTDPNKIWAR